MPTISEVREKRRMAEAEIAVILKDLETDTGCAVADLEILRSPALKSAAEPRIQMVLIQLEWDPGGVGRRLS